MRTVRSAFAGGRAVPGRWLDVLGSAGYVAKWVIYGGIGILALQTALGFGGSTEGSRGAVRTIANQPFGNVLLIVLSCGLVAYVLLRLAQAVLDVDRKGHDASGLVQRAGYLGSAVSYAALAYLTLEIVFSDGGGGTGTGAQASLTASALSSAFGQILVAAAGLVVIGVGGYQIYRITSGKYMERYQRSEMSERERRIARRTGQAGLAARGVVFGLIGIFVIQAAIQRDPSEARGFGEALASLARQPYGPYLLGATAAGLTCYAVYCFFRANYQRFDA